MGDEKNKDENNDFVKKLDDLAKGIESGFKSVNDEVKATKKKTEELDLKLSSRTDDKEEEKEEEDDYDFLGGGKKISEAIRKTKEEVKKEVREEVQQELARNQSFKDECNKWDQKAFEKFPALNQENSEFRRFVDKELDKEYPIGKDSKGRNILSPMAIYNAASRIAADNPEFLKIPNEEELESGYGFEKKIKGKGMNEVQTELAAYFGQNIKLNENRLKERAAEYNFKKHNRSGY